MRSPEPEPSRLRLVGTASLVVLATACGSQITHRYVDEPLGQSTQQGAPRGRSYHAQVELARARLRVVVKEASKCDVIRIQVVDRTLETLDDGDVIERKPVGRAQRVVGKSGSVPCQERFAQGARVALRIGQQTHGLGRADSRGVVEADLREVLEPALHGEPDTPLATLWVEDEQGRRHEAGSLSLVAFMENEQRIEALLAELNGLLDDAGSQPSNAQVTRGYTLYNQLRDLAPSDARVDALSARFVELLVERKQREQDARSARNLEVLGSVSELLGDAGTTVVIPGFVREAIVSRSLGEDVLRWAWIEAAMGLHTQRALCGTMPNLTFAGTSGVSGLRPRTRVAIGVLQSAHGSGFAQRLRGICTPR